MREHSRDRGRLEDIVKYAQNVNFIISGISYEEFTKDIRIYYSVMKNIEVIGEAANMLTRHFRETHAELPWRQIVPMIPWLQRYETFARLSLFLSCKPLAIHNSFRTFAPEYST